MKKEKSDLLHIQGATWGIEVFSVAAQCIRPWKLVVTLRGNDVRVVPYRDPAYKRWQVRLLRRAEAITAISEDLAAGAREVFNPPVPVEVIPNGLEPFWFQPATSIHSDRYVLFVGRLHPVKGVDVLLAAWQNVSRRFQDVTLWLVGDGPERQNLEEMVCELGVQRSVRFLGAVLDMEQLKALYSGALALVLPSRSEGLGNVLLEAGASGTICVGSSVGGIPEVIVDGETGFLFPPGDVDALAQTMAHVLEMSEAERRQMGERARQRIREHFSLERVVEQYIELYQRIAVSP
jgi:glycosyltransferase involved in cell wall biosynthesis